MRRHGGMRFVVALLGLALAACGTEDGSTSADDTDAGARTSATPPSAEPATEDGVEALRPKAAEITDQLAAHQWAEVRSQFDEGMKAKLAEDGLANAWAQVVKAKGEYVSRGEPTQLGSPAGEEHYVFDTPVEFEQGPMKTRLTFHADGTVAGLFILVPDA